MVCRSLISNAASSYPTQIGSNTFPEWSYSLEILGDIVPGAALNISAGSVSICSDSKHVIKKNNDNDYLIDDRQFYIYGSWKQSRVQIEDNLAIKCELIGSSNESLSYYLANLPTNTRNTVNIPMTNDYRFRFIDLVGFFLFFENKFQSLTRIFGIKPPR